MSNTNDAAREKLSRDLGIDVTFLEMYLKLQIDLEKVRNGDTSELYYVRVHQASQPVMIACASLTEATSISNNLAIAKEFNADIADMCVVQNAQLSDLSSCQIIIM